MRRILIIGNSDGIGLELTRTLLLEEHTSIWGLSRSPSPIQHPNYTHTLHDITSPDTSNVLHNLLADEKNPFDVLIYCAGIGDLFDPCNLSAETKTFEVNILGLVRSIEAILPSMLHAKRGHIIGLSSLADTLISKDSPAYSASKAAVSSYLEGLALALRKTPVRVSNIRFGFVDTKMAKGPARPLMMTRAKAVRHIQHTLKKRPIRLSRPLPLAAAVAAITWATHAAIWSLSILGG